jgi:spore germination cell wall hydrolase CwlJ-like protein
MRLPNPKGEAAMDKFFRYFLFCIFGVVFINTLNAIIDLKFSSYPQDFSDSKITLKERERQLNCLTKNIYYEAATEPFEGKVAVAQVTINRAESGKFPDDICKVVYQKNSVYDKIICQFSWYCESQTIVRPIHENAYRESEAVAKKVLLEGFRLDGLKEALFYHADYVNPRWGKEKITKIGRHIFYKG